MERKGTSLQGACSRSCDLSVVIPTRNSAETIEKAVLSIQSNADRSCEVIVVDGGSSDATLEIAESLGAIVVKGNLGRSSARLRGAQIASGRYFLFLDSD